MRKSEKNPHTFIKIVIVVVIVVLFGVRYVSFPELAKFAEVKHDAGKLEIHTIDVGQAESILIVQGEHAMLIDTGEMDCGKTVTEYLKSVGISKLDVLVLTHFHKDHAGGFHKVISSIDVEKVLCMSPKHLSTYAEEVWYVDMMVAKYTSQIIHRHEIPVVSPYDENGKLKSFKLGDAVVQILSQDREPDVVNNKSIVMKVTYGEYSALLMADVQDEIEKILVESGIDLKANTLKIGHHGSRTSTTDEFLDMVSPEYALISCGEDNDYGHPTPSTLEKLLEREIKVYRTDLNGTIVIETDGKIENVKVTTEK